MQKRSLNPEDIYRIKHLSQMDLSPDEESVVYVVGEADQKEDKVLRNLYLTSLKTGETKKLTHIGKDSAPLFSPDGTRIAFISSRSGKDQIWILPLEGGEPWHLPTEEVVEGIEWVPDGKGIIFTSQLFCKEKEWKPYPGAPDYDGKRLQNLAKKIHEEEGKEPGKEEKAQLNETKVITRFKYRADGKGYLGDVRSQVLRRMVPSDPVKEKLEPASCQLTGADFDYRDPAVSPDGQHLIMVSRQTEEADLENQDDLYLLNLETNESYLIYEGPGPIMKPLWSPCGDYIAFVGHDNGCGHSTTFHLWLLEAGSIISSLAEGDEIVPRNEKEAVNVTGKLDRPAYGACWAGDELYFILGDQGAGSIYKCDRQGRLEKVFLSRDCSVSSIKIRDENLLCGVSGPAQMPEFYRLRGSNIETLTHFNKDLQDELSLGEWQSFTYRSDDEQEIEAWVIYPPGFRADEEYPMLLLIHGGPHGAYGPSFMFKAQLFASRGYVVLYTNPRGSETYGQEFASCIDGNWGQLDYRDIMSGVDALSEKGFIKEDSMFAFGWSYGGYMACWIATQTNRFRAICAGASITNMLSGYGTSDITLADEWEYGGQPWQDAEELLRQSPLNYVENVKTPLMLVHGENDLRCHPAQTEEFFVALRRLGKEVVMVRYPEEFHGLKRPLHEHDLQQRLLSWFQHYRQADE